MRAGKPSVTGPVSRKDGFKPGTPMADPFAMFRHRKRGVQADVITLIERSSPPPWIALSQSPEFIDQNGYLPTGFVRNQFVVS
jgi:hypothetical protein